MNKRKLWEFKNKQKKKEGEKIKLTKNIEANKTQI